MVSIRKKLDYIDKTAIGLLLVMFIIIGYIILVKFYYIDSSTINVTFVNNDICTEEYYVSDAKELSNIIRSDKVSFSRWNNVKEFFSQRYEFQINKHQKLILYTESLSSSDDSLRQYFHIELIDDITHWVRGDSITKHAYEKIIMLLEEK